jgi:hypothetical protein
VSFSTNIDQSSAIAARVKEQAQVKIAVGVPFISDADLQTALDEAGVSSTKTTNAAVDAYSEARLDGLRAALAILALLAMCALFAAQRIPETQPGGVKS